VGVIWTALVGIIDVYEKKGKAGATLSGPGVPPWLFGGGGIWAGRDRQLAKKNQRMKGGLARVGASSNTQTWQEHRGRT